MSHVDDGTLHAYLDGELAPPERERVEGHLAGCPSCRVRLDEERSLIERATRLLDLAAPDQAGVAPPLRGLRRPPRWWRFRTPLVWAATVVLAAGLGWYLRGGAGRPARQVSGERVAVAAAPESAPAAPAGQSVAPVPGRQPTPRSTRMQSPGAEPAEDRAPTPLPRAAVTGAAQRRSGAEALASPESTRGPTQVLAAPSLAAAAEPATVNAERLASSWTLIDSATAREVLGAAPVRIPGRPVRAWRRGPGPLGQVALEQEMGGGILVVLIEQRGQETTGAQAPAARAAPAPPARPAGERLARFVGSLRVEIAGPLPADSLSRLLDLVR